MPRYALCSAVLAASLLSSACSWWPWAPRDAAPPPPPRPARALSATAPAPTASRVASGQDAYYAQQVARDKSCAAPRQPAMIDKGAGYEIYTVTCADGQALNIRCEFGTCREQR